MRTETTTRELFKFDELTEDQKEKAVAGLYDINVDHGWWDHVYEDAERIGARITAFDTGRSSMIDISCIDAEETAMLIKKEHGKDCETYLLASTFLNERDAIVTNAPQDEDREIEDEYALQEDLNERDADFVKALGEEYLSILGKESEYLMSRESIEETIGANDYEFTSEGILA